MFGSIYLVGGLSALFHAIKRNRPLPILLSGGISLAAGWFLHSDGWRMAYLPSALGILLTLLGVYRTIRRFGGSRVQLAHGR